MTEYEKAKAGIEQTLSEPWASESLKRCMQAWWDHTKAMVEDGKPPNPPSTDEE
jgi:hypothetical protein